MGEHDIRTLSDGIHQDIFIVKSKSHPFYNRQTYANDIAVIHLGRDVIFNGTVKIHKESLQS